MGETSVIRESPGQPYRLSVPNAMDVTGRAWVGDPDTTGKGADPRDQPRHQGGPSGACFRWRLRRNNGAGARSSKLDSMSSSWASKPSSRSAGPPRAGKQLEHRPGRQNGSGRPTSRPARQAILGQIEAGCNDVTEIGKGFVRSRAGMGCYRTRPNGCRFDAA